MVANIAQRVIAAERVEIILERNNKNRKQQKKNDWARIFKEKKETKKKILLKQIMGMGV